MRRYRLAVMLALALWPSLASAAEVTTFNLKTTRDLLEICTTPESDALRKEAVAAGPAEAQPRNRSASPSRRTRTSMYGLFKGRTPRGNPHIPVRTSQ